MGIQINGQTDIISATDGALNVSGASLGSASASSLNISGIVTASGGFSGNVTGNINSSGVSTFSGGIVVAAGSTSAPSITPTGDSNTGIFFPSPDTVAIAEGGVEALRVDSSGNFGLGTNNPFQKLHIQNTTSPLTLNLKLNKNSTTNDYAEIAFQLWADASSGETVFGGSGTSRPSGVIRCLNESGSNAAGSLIFATFSGGSTNSTVTEKMRIDSSGRVTAPYQPCFLASRSSTQTYSASNTIIFDTEVFDQNSNYNNSTGVFTAPVTGRYLFLTTVLVQGSTTGNEYDMQISTSNRSYYAAPGRIEYQLGTTWGDGYIALGAHQIADMDINDTALVKFNNFGGGSIYGTGGGDWTRFSGYLLC
jgi:hypothetical protein